MDPGTLLDECGLAVIDIQDDPEFVARRWRDHDFSKFLEAMHRISQASVEHPHTILQELVNAALDLCGADSAGISLVKESGTDADYYHWVATAGQYSAFLNANLPRYPSACGITLERGRPQHFRVTQRFFDIMGIEAPLVTDGLLLPWQVNESRGTIFVMAHGRAAAFDERDSRVLQILAAFAASGVRQQQQQQLLLQQASIAAAARMANELAHQINNPLQSLTNILYLVCRGENANQAESAAAELGRLVALVRQLLALPTPIERPPQ